LAYRDTWALVDANQDVQTPAPMLSRDTSPFFLVIATSPQVSRWEGLDKNKEQIGLWFMKPFTLAELIQARQLQKITRSEEDIEDFFEKYGPSARDCYIYCHDKGLDSYHSNVQGKVKGIKWDVLTQILTSGTYSLEMDEISHKILLVEPQPGNRAVSRISIVTKLVGQLLWDRNLDEQWRNHQRLFMTLRQATDAKGFCGRLFEPPFHALCVRGAKFTIYPMTWESEGPVNYKFTNVEGNDSETLVLGRQERFSFNKDNRIKKLLANHYYQPTARNYPSFIYDPDSHQISAFQFMNGEGHGVVSKEVQALHELGKALEINGLSIRIIVVVLEGDKITLSVEKKLYDRLGLRAYFLEVTLCDLYNLK